MNSYFTKSQTENRVQQGKAGKRTHQLQSGFISDKRDHPNLSSILSKHSVHSCVSDELHLTISNYLVITLTHKLNT